LAHVALHLRFLWRAYVRSGQAHAVKLALCLDGLPVGDLPAIAAEAERRGFHKILAAETVGAEPYVACAAMAAATRSILVGTGIAGIHGRSAASTAMAVASPADLEGLRRNVAAILDGALASP
jgi:alkanesulfonate monooxygenase SsuD/methylene tetrahydromethanopterin reductase-like flavin-dependent oxidoreductase (luciferase family)